MRRVIVHYKPSRPTRSLEVGKRPDGKARRRMFHANTTRVMDQVEADAILAAAKAAGIVADFTFQILQDTAEALTHLDLPELSIGDAVTKAVGNLLDPDHDGKLGKAKAKAKAAGQEG